jgi:hypothetical protein
MSLSVLREALAANLDTIPDVQASAYVMANPTPPMIQVLPAGIGYDRTMGRGHDDVTFTVQAIVALTLDVGSQKLLDRLCENAAPYSVKAAIEADKTLGGACQDLHVTEASGLQVVEVQTGGARLVVEWTVLILAGGLV